jgi:hypothetical protein
VSASQPFIAAKSKSRSVAGFASEGQGSKVKDQRSGTLLLPFAFCPLTFDLDMSPTSVLRRTHLGTIA